jgi:hypothetical protein
VRETAAASSTGAGRLVGNLEDLWLRLPSSLRPGVELARVQLTAAWAEPVHAHLVHVYPIRRGWGGTRPRATHDGRDGTPHANENSFSQVARRCYAETICCKRLF